MEGYILDNLNGLYKPTGVVIDQFESFIWTERNRDIGDFELDVLSTIENRARFKPGVWLGMDKSHRVMAVETTEDAFNDDGKRLIKVTGRSLEAVLDNRIARGNLSDLTTEPKWSLTGTPLNIATQIYHDVCATGTLDQSDIVGAEEGSIFPPSTIPAPPDVVTIEVQPSTVYQAIKQICDIFYFGFRIVRDSATGQLYFDIYTGSDRTTDQTALPAVIFSPQLDNMKNTRELNSNLPYKNVAYVISPVGHEIVYAPNTSQYVTGFDRRVLLVTADDITDTDPAVASAKMIQRGKDQLALNTMVAGFDGQLSEYCNYIYETDYFLGDIVEQRSGDGLVNQMQVTEQIFIHDSEGERSYPTLSLFKFITPGSWASWDANQTWLDLDADPITWSEEP